MKLSILILTHERPSLFARCLASTLHNIPSDVEILVLNDSHDIQEVKHPQVQYFYNKFDNLSMNYEFVLGKARGEYVYYLEDDDYLVNNFYDIIDDYLKYDIIGASYYPDWNDDWIMKCSTTMSKGFILDDDVFQLGQFIMCRTLVDTFVFPKDSHIHNDRKLVDHVLGLSKTMINIPKIIYHQTTDGGDNISFPESRKYYGT
jgi:hypothetical protein